MHSLRSITLLSHAPITLLSLLTICSFSTAETVQIALTTVAPIPTTWTVPATCLSASEAPDADGGTIYNVGCGKVSRTTCCPPGWTTGVIFAKQTATASGTSTYGCPRGYGYDVIWGDSNQTPDVAGTMVCCPLGITYWSTFGVGRDPLCYTQSPYTKKSGSTKVSVSEVSTYARPFFIAEDAVSQPSSSSPRSTSVPASTTASVTASTTAATTRSSSQIAGSTTAGGSEETQGSGQTGGDNQESKSGLGPGAIAGIVIGVVVPIAIGVIAFILWRRKRVLGAMGMHIGGIQEDPPVPPPAISRGGEFYPLNDPSESSTGWLKAPPPLENAYGEYGYSQYRTSETAISGINGEGYGMENQQRPLAAFENAEKVPEHSENEAVKYDGHYSRHAL